MTQEQQPAENTPDAGALAAELKATRDQLQAATQDVAAAMRTANPDLPENVFAGDTIAAVKASVSAARAVADHIAASQPAPVVADPAPTPVIVAPIAVPPTPPTTRTPETPSGLTGIERIKAGLTNRS